MGVDRIFSVIEDIEEIRYCMGQEKFFRQSSSSLNSYDLSMNLLLFLYQLTSQLDNMNLSQNDKGITL